MYNTNGDFHQSLIIPLYTFKYLRFLIEFSLLQYVQSLPQF